MKHKRFIAPTLKFISTSHKSKVFGYKILSKLNSHIQEFKSEKDYYSLVDRRHKILKNIITNNKQYAPLANFFLVWCDSISIISAESPKEKIAKRVNELQLFIDTYPNSEFAQIAKIEMIEIKTFTESTEKIVELYKEIFNKNNNFYIGGCDLYSSIYYQLMNLFCDLKDKESTFFFMTIKVDQHFSLQRPAFMI